MNILAKISNFKSFREERKLTKKAKSTAWGVNNAFDQLPSSFKKQKIVQTKYNMIKGNYERFLMANQEDYTNQNIAQTQKLKRARNLLLAAMVFSSILAVKGLQYFLAEFYGPVPLVIIVVLGLILSGFFVVGSIYLNVFAEDYRKNKSGIFFISKMAAIVLVLFIPMMNFFEGLSSHYTEFAMALNLFAVLVDIILNTALISMGHIFILSENAKEAKKIILKKQKEVQEAENKLVDSNTDVYKSITAFRFAAKKFVSAFEELHIRFPKATTNILFLLDNLTIYMINSKVYQHNILPYHTNDEGNPVVERYYFTSNGNSLSEAYDFFEKTTTAQSRPQESNNQQEEVPSQPDADQQGQQDEPEEVENNKIPSDYETIFEEFNDEDKYL